MRLIFITFTLAAAHFAIDLSAIHWLHHKATIINVSLYLQMFRVIFLFLCLYVQQCHYLHSSKILKID